MLQELLFVNSKGKIIFKNISFFSFSVSLSYRILDDAQLKHRTFNLLESEIIQFFLIVQYR